MEYVLQTDAGQWLGTILMIAFVIGTMILRRQAAAKARRDQAERAARGEAPPPPQPRPEAEEPVEPAIEDFLRQIGLRPPVSPPAPVAPPAPPMAPRPLLVRVPNRPAAVRPPLPPPSSPLAAAAPALGIGPAVTERTAAVQARLLAALTEDLKPGSPSLRKAILLTEILGRPRAMRPHAFGEGDFLA
jgi:hypothetical protein